MRAGDDGVLVRDRPAPDPRPAVGSLIVRSLGLCEYADTVEAMRAFTEARDDETRDQIWLLEHPPVFTLGRAARASHILDPGRIPVVRTDRGGQVTYHGPGQLVVYLLIDLQRRGLGIKRLVETLEEVIIELLSGLDIEAARRAGAPGVYVRGRKIASLGLRVRRGCTYHGISLNVAMDLSPFSRIEPCGIAGLEVTQLADLTDVDARAMPRIGDDLAQILARRIGYNDLLREDQDIPTP
jgi:lipoyl(octanoyl) transferase